MATEVQALEDNIALLTNRTTHALATIQDAAGTRRAHFLKRNAHLSFQGSEEGLMEVGHKVNAIHELFLRLRSQTLNQTLQDQLERSVTVLTQKVP